LETDNADCIRWEQRVRGHLEHGQDVEQARQVVGELGERLLDQHQSVAPTHARESEQINEASADRIGVARIAEAERAALIHKHAQHALAYEPGMGATSKCPTTHRSAALTFSRTGCSCCR
jgi:hypothetical protein